MKDIFDKPRLMLALSRGESLQGKLEAHLQKTQDAYSSLSEAEQEVVEVAYEDFVSLMHDIIGSAEDLNANIRGLLSYLDED